MSSNGNHIKPNIGPVGIRVDRSEVSYQRPQNPGGMQSEIPPNERTNGFDITRLSQGGRRAEDY